MDYQGFYEQLFQPIEERIGPIDKVALRAIVGFDCGGPIALSTVGYDREEFVTYITCELAWRTQQQPAKFGRYEFLLTCDDEGWARKILTKMGQMSMECAFEHGNTVDIDQIVGSGCPLQGLVLEEFGRTLVDARNYGLFRLHGVTRSELNFAMEFGVDELLERLERANIFPHTSIHRRESVTRT